jgi:3-oxoacyl-[acyl-carrier protein] reductase
MSVCNNSSPGSLIITGNRKGLGRALTDYYLDCGWQVAGCSRSASDLKHPNYRHFCLDVADEVAVSAMVAKVQLEWDNLYGLINNAGIASMNHALLTPTATFERIFSTNTTGCFIFCREFAKRVHRTDRARIINFSTIAEPLSLAGESAYAASKAAVESLTRILAREFAALKITVNAIGPTPIDSDLIRGIPQSQMNALLNRQPIQRMGTIADLSNVTDFFLRPESDFITGQIIYLGGVSG